MSSITSLLSTSPEQSDLQWFQLIFFAAAVPVLTVDYLIHRRAPGGQLGWLFLWNFATLRLVAYILIKTANSLDQVITGTIIASASLSPLFFATIGIWHEVAHWHKQKHPLLYGWRTQIILHLLVGGATAMAIAGSVTAYSGHGQSSSSSRPLEIVGMVGFLGVLLVICLLLLNLWQVPTTQNERRLLTAVGLAVPLLALRVLYSLVGAAIDSPSWSYYRGPLAAQIIMQVLPDCLIVICYAVVGIMTRGIVKERQDDKQLSAQ